MRYAGTSSGSERSASWSRRTSFTTGGSATYAAPGVRASARKRTARFDRDLVDHPPAEWRPDIDLVPVAGDVLTEVDFCHRPSSTLILTDLIENFQRERVTCWHLRLLMKLGGVFDPDGKTPTTCG